MLTERKELRADDGAPQYNKYYMRAASRYRTLKWSSLLLFTVYLVVMLLFYRDSITYENMLYLMRDLSISRDTATVFAPIIYEPEQQMVFAPFKNELAIATSTGLRLYDAGGRCMLSDSVSFKNPSLVAGEKYLALYDSGGNEYAIFTSLAMVHRKTTDGTLQSLDVSDTGRYLTVTRSAEAKYKVTLYSSAFSEVATYYRDAYVTAAALSADGHSVAILSLKHDDWNIAGSVSLASDSSAEMHHMSLGTSLPIAANYLENGNLAVVCDDSFVCISPSGEIVSDYSLQSMTLSCFDISDSNTVLVASSNVLGTENRILLFDKNGELVVDTLRHEKVSSVTAGEGVARAYIVYDHRAESLTPQSSATAEVSDHVLVICEIGGYPLLCANTRAESAVFVSPT